MEIKLVFDEKEPVLSFAAAELKKYLERMDPTCRVGPGGGEGLSLEIGVRPGLHPAGGAPAEDPALDDRIRIRLEDGHGEILGTNARAALIGVYRLLRELGCRFLQPGSRYEVVPSRSLCGARVELEEGAALRHRGVCIEGANSVENILDFIDWLPKMGYNSFFVQFWHPTSFLNYWYAHKFNPLLKGGELDDKTVERMSAEIDAQIARRGLLHHRVGHGWTCKTLGISPNGWDKTDLPLPQGKAPLLAQVNGERAFFYGVPLNTNLCLSNPDAVRALTDCVADYAQEHPEVDMLHVWLADDHNNVCECDECKKHLPTDQYVALLNSIDAALAEKGLSTRIVFLLYHELLWAPRREKLENPGRFVLMFAPISRTFERSYTIPAPDYKLPEYRRNRISLPVDIEENTAFLQAWKRVFQGDSFVYDYPLGRAHYGDPGYLKIAGVILEDIRALEKMGLRGYISCQELRAFFPNALPNYLMGLALWNPALEMETCVEDYFSHLYGEPWRKALDYLSALSRLHSPDYFNRVGPRHAPALAQRYRQAEETAEAFSACAREQAQKQEGIHKIFWERLDYHWKYSKLLSGALSRQADGDETRSKQEWLAFLELIRENEAAFQDCLDVYRMVQVASRYAGCPRPENEEDR